MTITDNDMNILSTMSDGTFNRLQTAVAESEAFRSQQRKLQSDADALRVRDSIERLFDVDTTVLSDGFIQKIENRLSELLMHM